MPKQLTDKDKRLLHLLQSKFSLVAEPFKAVAQELGSSNDEVLCQVQTLKQDNIIRYVGPTFDSRQLGYHGVLVAMQVEPNQLDEVASIISKHSGVSHNYAREHKYNLWFTLTLSSDRDLAAEVALLEECSGVIKTMMLPALRLFKIDVRFDFDMSDDNSSTIPDRTISNTASAPLSETEIKVVKELQEDLPITNGPFNAMASHLEMSVPDFLGISQGLLDRGIMRRYGAVLNHRQSGYTANAMVCWDVPDDLSEKVGIAMAAFSAVTHCYERPRHSDWHYNMFTMIHGHTHEECEIIAKEISEQTDIKNYAVLYSTKQYKKEKIKYFA